MIIVLAGSDIHVRFICATAHHSGITSDIVAWHDSILCYFLEVQKGHPSKYFFISDEAFTNTQQFFSPWPGGGLDQCKDPFNYWLSHSHQCMKPFLWNAYEAMGNIAQCQKCRNHHVLQHQSYQVHFGQ